MAHPSLRPAKASISYVHIIGRAARPTETRPPDGGQCGGGERPPSKGSYGYGDWLAGPGSASGGWVLVVQVVDVGDRLRPPLRMGAPSADDALPTEPDLTVVAQAARNWRRSGWYTGLAPLPVCRWAAPSCLRRGCDPPIMTRSLGRYRLKLRQDRVVGVDDSRSVSGLPAGQAIRIKNGQPTSCQPVDELGMRDLKASSNGRKPPGRHNKVLVLETRPIAVKPDHVQCQSRVSSPRQPRRTPLPRSGCASIADTEEHRHLRR
jgi:hypothetical protein